MQSSAPVGGGDLMNPSGVLQTWSLWNVSAALGADFFSFLSRIHSGASVRTLLYSEELRLLEDMRRLMLNGLNWLKEDVGKNLVSIFIPRY